MATKEDILEQIVEDYLIQKGYFVQHNLKFKPRPDHQEFIKNQDSNHSDIDVIGFNPKLDGFDRVWAVSCKSWQAGFSPFFYLGAIKEKKRVNGREAWRGFRELTNPKWSEAFIDAVEAASGTREFTYVTAVTKVRGDREVWENHEPFRAALGGNPTKIITFSEMFREIRGGLTTTLAATEVGRLIQLIESSDIRIGDG